MRPRGQRRAGHTQGRRPVRSSGHALPHLSANLDTRCAWPRPAGPSAQGGGRRVSFPWPRVMRPKPTAFTSDASPFRVRRSQPPAPRPARRPADLLHQPRTADRQAHGPRESHAGWPSEPAPSVHVTHRNRYLRGLSWPSCPGKSSKGQTGKWLRLQHRTPMREPAPNPRTAVKTLLS